MQTRPQCPGGGSRCIDCCGRAVTRRVGGVWVLSRVTLTWRQTLPCRRAKLVLGSAGDGVHPQRGSRGASQRKRYRSEILEGQAGGDVVEDGEQH